MEEKVNRLDEIIQKVKRGEITECNSIDDLPPFLLKIMGLGYVLMRFINLKFNYNERFFRQY